MMYKPSSSVWVGSGDSVGVGSGEPVGSGELVGTGVSVGVGIGDSVGSGDSVGVGVGVGGKEVALNEVPLQPIEGFDYRRMSCLDPLKYQKAKDFWINQCYRIERFENTSYRAEKE